MTLRWIALAGLVATVVVATTTAASAAPAADLVVLWLPDHDVAPIARAGRDAGAAVLDRTPVPAAADDAAALVARGIDAYEALRVDDAWAALAAARAVVDRSGAAGLGPAALSDLALYRGLVELQRGAPTAAWEELIAALTVAPVRVFDPARFSPRVIDELERARRAVLARPTVALHITAPSSCAIAIDGLAIGRAAPAAGATPTVAAVVAGGHWIAATCGGGGRWGGRVDAREPVTAIAIVPPVERPPTDDEVLIAARAAGARAVAVVVARAEVVSIRLLGVDGRERTRRAVAAADGAPAIALAVTEVLRSVSAAGAGRPARARWRWAAGAALVAVAIAVPLTLVLAGDDAPDVTIRGPGRLP